jgi:penicillin-binding protein 1A
MASAYCTFANGGLRAPPYAAVEIANSHGEVIYRRDRDAPPLNRIFDESLIATMDSMLLNNVETGTGQRAKLDNIEVAGKTGTTNGYKDAWFIGFTGNFVGAIWFGNDDDTPMEKMTGGSLPAATWHDVMAFAHRGVEPKPLFGRPAPPRAAPENAADHATAAAGPQMEQQPTILTPSAVAALREIEAAMNVLAKQRAEAGASASGVAVKNESPAAGPGANRKASKNGG